MPTINSRDAYLAYRAEWKTSYKRLSADIRATKLALKRADREGQPTGGLWYQLLHGRDNATAMLAELAEVKETARRHRETIRKAA